MDAQWAGGKPCFNWANAGVESLWEETTASHGRDLTVKKGTWGRGRSEIQTTNSPRDHR